VQVSRCAGVPSVRVSGPEIIELKRYRKLVTLKRL